MNILVHEIGDNFQCFDIIWFHIVKFFGSVHKEKINISKEFLFNFKMEKFLFFLNKNEINICRLIDYCIMTI